MLFSLQMIEVISRQAFLAVLGMFRVRTLVQKSSKQTLQKHTPAAVLKEAWHSKVLHRQAKYGPPCSKAGHWGERCAYRKQTHWNTYKP